ncbi:MAG: SHOCT domain-containing protein, partial [Gaiellaceae bacterium]
LFGVWGDIFRRRDLSGLGKTGWFIFTLVLPFLGVFVYVVSQNDGMNQRNLERAQAQRAQMDDYVRSTAGSGGAAAEIEKAKQLLDSGAITQPEFDALKQKALA